jgi:hypothetical protein
LPSGSAYLTSELKTNININSTIKKGVGDKWVQITYPVTPSLAFNDANHPAMDGMIAAFVDSQNGTFYATGSNLLDAGPKFQQPLWDKTKIEIDLTPKSNHSFGITNFTSGSDSYIMAFFNKTQGKWIGVGSGKEPILYSGTDQSKTAEADLFTFLQEKASGFGGTLSTTLNNGVLSGSYIFSQPISNFGFPFHDKYSGSVDTTFALSDYITEPFLVEKIVLYWSGAYASNNTLQTPSYITSNTFFILNQRNIQQFAPIKHIITIISGSSSVLNEDRFLKRELTSSYSATSRDLVTWMQIVKQSTLAAPADLFNNNFIIGREKIYSVGGGDDYSGQFIMSGVVKNPIAYERGANVIINDPGSGSFASRSVEYFETWYETGRNNTGDRGRNWKNVLFSPQKLEANVTLTSLRGGIGFSLDANKLNYKNNPYILLPSDQLIFGWQVSTFRDAWNYWMGIPVYSGSGPAMSFSTNGIHKIVLYGSLLRVGSDGFLEEYHNTSTQPLTSISVNEIIG